MLVLFDLNQILIKASYYEKTDLATLTDFEMEIARKNFEATNGFPTATSVEVCQCPAPYTGDSCQVNFLKNCISAVSNILRL